MLYVSKPNFKPQKKGIAIILALLIVAIVVTIVTDMLSKQNILVRTYQQQKNNSTITALNYGALAWAKLLLKADRNNIDYRQENWLWGIEKLDISDFIAQDNADKIYLSAYMQDAQSKLNLNNLVSKINIDLNKYEFIANKEYIKFYEALLKNLNIKVELAAKTAEYIATSLNSNSSGQKNITDNSNINTPNINLKTVFDLHYIGYSDDEIIKLSKYINIIENEFNSKININTCSPILIEIFLPSTKILNSANFFEKNPHLYANSTSEIISYLRVDAVDINITYKFFTTQTNYVDVLSKINYNKQNNFSYVRLLKNNQNIINSLNGKIAKSLYGII